MTTDLEAILQRAREAQRQWAARPLSVRLQPVHTLRARLASAPVPLADIVAREIGKTRTETIGAEILPVAEACAFLLDRAPKLLAPRRETLRGVLPFAGSAIIQHQPWGVVATLVPWNYPLFLCAVPVLNALVAGNAAVMKASPRAKETVAAFGRWLVDAGFPPDLVPVLDSSDDMGRKLSASPLVDRIIFTGSSKTGRAILKAAAENLVPATVELSGCDAVFVLRDANLTLAADAVTFGLRINAGRTCICPRRLFVEEPVAEPFLTALKDRTNRLKLQTPMDPQTLREADELAQRLTAAGAIALNERREGDAEKALVVSGDAKVMEATQGNFVPALVATKVKNIDEALSLEAQSPYALGASVFSRDVKAAVGLASRLRAGIIGINECVAYGGEAALPFGGRDESGYGVRGGEEGLMEMTRPQALAIARGSFRPHHVAETEAEAMLLALLRARHSGTFFGRLKGLFDYGREAIAWRPPKH
ncbi:MAG TPA: aldehyde dehydrogenase family protein [Planctomycetota bacterium]|nr:aldehyde dehydrogenase family protein [Planctomycetota bacterium]